MAAVSPEAKFQRVYLYARPEGAPDARDPIHGRSLQSYAYQLYVPPVDPAEHGYLIAAEPRGEYLTVIPIPRVPPAYQRTLTEIVVPADLLNHTLAVGKLLSAAANRIRAYAGTLEDRQLPLPFLDHAIGEFYERMRESEGLCAQIVACIERP